MMKINVLMVFLSFCGVFLTLSPAIADDTGFGENEACYVLNKDEFWYCGAQSKFCKNKKQRSGDTGHVHYHKEELIGKYVGLGSKNYFCCYGSGVNTGRYVESAGTSDPRLKKSKEKGEKLSNQGWIKELKTVTEKVYDEDGSLIGICKWEQEINVCGDVDNPDDKCDRASDDCEQGYISHNGKCLEKCPAGQAFAAGDSNECVKVNPKDPRQGVKQSTIVNCKSDEIFEDGQCVKLTQLTAISSQAFDECWQKFGSQELKECVLNHQNSND